MGLSSNSLNFRDGKLETGSKWREAGDGKELVMGSWWWRAGDGKLETGSYDGKL
ncbi:hypothetical protein HPP92_007109, partial [Vanilla planifolia]